MDVDTCDDFADWVRPHWSSMSRLALRLAGPGDWEDVLQESLTLAWRKRDRFDPTRGTPRTWLLALVVDRAGKSRRSARNTVRLVEVEQRGADLDQHLDLDHAVEQLTHRQRVIVELFYFLGLPVAEVADVLHCSQGTVKSTLSDARTRLRGLLKENAHD